MPDKVTASQIRDFQNSPVWVEMVERITREAGTARNKAIDASDPREAGKCRAYELVLGLPESLMIESEEGKGVISRLRKITR